MTRTKATTILDKVHIWYDAEGDYLEVDLGEPQDGNTAETSHKGVHVKLDDEHNIIGFSIIGVTTLQEEGAKPFEVDLSSKPSFQKRKLLKAHKPGLTESSALEDDQKH